ncbi:hypothetical protein [Streptomyces parvulus]|uniref:hypothetical protein n=1 Tax=Streptomyces parvulus TaxID=146923 RepID=UPI00210EDAFB|nr:hypothetical protein [Streptomyces parvulus]MCQ4196826.1 hypothetical protein [Streptomyces parvulus]
MSTRQTLLHFAFYFWLLATSGAFVVYYIPWLSGTRVPGRRLGGVPLLKRLGRRTAEDRLGAVKDELTRRRVPCADLQVLTKKPLVDQVHAHSTWLPLSRLVFAVPGMFACAALALVVVPSEWRTSPLWAIGVYLAFTLVSAMLTCVDILAVRNADPTGTVTAVAVGVLESFTTRSDKAPAKSTPVAWQSRMVEQLCTALVRRAHRESVGAVPGSRLAMASSTASVARALRHHTTLVHGATTCEERTTHERELMRLICSLLTYSSRPRALVVDFRVCDADRLANLPEAVPDATAMPSPKARVIVPLLFLCVLVAMAVGLGITGAVGEFTAPIVVTLAMAAAPIASRFGVTVFDSLAEPLSLSPAAEALDTRPAADAVRRAA